MLQYLPLLILGFSPVFADEQAVKDVHAHLAIKDIVSACEEARLGIERDTGDKALWEVYIKALAKAGDEIEMIRAWRSYTEHFPEEAANHEMIESMAWGVIENASQSQLPMVRTIALLAAFFSQDAKGVDILYRGLKENNSFLRGVAVQLSANMRDVKLRDEILHMLKKEQVWVVRLEVIKAVGSMKIVEAKPILTAIIESDSSAAEEKAAAISAIVNLLETADRNEITRLANSERAGLRILAAHAVAYLDLKDHLDLIFPLIQDNRAEVRAAALEAIGTLRISTFDGKSIQHLVKKRLKDLDVKVAITAAWVLLLNDPVEGQIALEPWLSDPSRETRLLASAALAKSGKYGFPLIWNTFQTTSDHYVKMNLALGLIGQRVHCNEACSALNAGMNRMHERWMWEEIGLFKYLAPSDVEHNPAIPNYPEALNQSVRLEILNILALMKFPDAQQGIKKFLQERTWGISGLASALLLSEGDEEAVELVKNLLKDPNGKVRIQAALILAFWDSGEDAVFVLQESYCGANREMKERILEGIGRVKSSASLAFLIKNLEESSQTLRIIAASSLLQSLYH